MSRREPEVVRSPEAEMVRSEERLDTDVRAREAGKLRARKSVSEHDLEQRVPREVEHAEIERQPAAEADSGEIETLPDGSISIPVFEEELVVEKRRVVRERVIVRKRRVTDEQRVQATLRREHVDVEADDAIADRVHGATTEPRPGSEPVPESSVPQAAQQQAAPQPSAPQSVQEQSMPVSSLPPPPPPPR